MTILAVDPSSRSCGWCLADDTGKVLYCGVVRATRIGLLKRRIQELYFDIGWRHTIQCLAIERTPVTSRRGTFTDSWGPGIAAGIWLAEWCRGDSAEPLLSKPAEWRKAMVGKHRGRDAYKAAAIQRANAELLASGLPQLDPAMAGLDDVADAVCLAVYAARRAE